jgi:hypothetical protein
MASLNEKSRPISEDIPDIESEQILTQDATDDPSVRDSILVDWDGEDEPEKPTNWTGKEKWANGSLLALMTFITYGDSSTH